MLWNFCDRCRLPIRYSIEIIITITKTKFKSQFKIICVTLWHGQILEKCISGFFDDDGGLFLVVVFPSFPVKKWPSGWLKKLIKRPSW